MNADPYVTQGDITQLAADAIVYSTSTAIGGTGKIHSAFSGHVPDFEERLERIRQQHPEPRKVGDAYWMPLSPDRKPHGIVVAVVTGDGQDREAAARAAVLGAV